MPRANRPAETLPACAVTVDVFTRSERKTIGIYVLPDGRVEVRAPLRASRARIREFIAEKAVWIRAKQTEARARGALPAAHTYTEGDRFLYLGQAYPLHIVKDAKRALEFKDAFLLAESARPQARQLLEAWYRARARQVIGLRVAFFSGLHGFTETRLRIGSARTRWGSCSSTGTLSFPWRLVMAPPQVIDYVVVHELAHTVEHNHGRGFWARVEKILPEYKALRQWLKENGKFLL